MHMWGHDSDDGDTSSTELEHDSIEMLADHVCSNDDDFWM
jgi:hypothetical protein